ncbi:MAG: ATP-binding cassette domain-containing protein, partial [Thermoproteota archaeon]
MTALTTNLPSMESSPFAPSESSSTIDTSKYKMIAENVTVSYGGIDAVKNVTMKFKEKSVTALIGPSGCGKTTFLRCLNRMHDMTKNAKVTGKVMIDDIDLYSK